MANVLAMSKLQSILTLRSQGWSRHRIARELGIDRKTVRRYLATLPADSKSPTPAPIGSEGVDKGGVFSNPAIAPLGNSLANSNGLSVPDDSAGLSADGSPPHGQPSPFVDLASLERLSDPSGRLTPPTSSLIKDGLDAPDDSKSPTQAPLGSLSRCQPFRDIILAKIDQGLNSHRIYQDLVSEHGFTGKYWSVRRFVAALANQSQLPFRRMETDPGVEAQMDFGQGAWTMQPNGKRRRPHLLRVVLSHSRKAYSEVVWKQSTDEVIRVLENAFHHFGGTPKTLVPDNLKAAVIQADYYDPLINPKFHSFCQHYGMAVLPTKPRMPRHKGKVENGINYVQDNGVKGREFAGLGQHNSHLLHWETHVADQRLHGTTRKQVAKVFEEVEKPALQPLPPDRFPCFHEARRSVHRDGHIEVAKAYYSVPPEYLGHEVWARWDGRMVRIFNLQMKEIAVHVHRHPGQFSSLGEHIAKQKISNIEKGKDWMLDKISLIGPEAHAWAKAMLLERGIEGIRVLQGLISMKPKYPLGTLEQACRVAHSHQAYRLRTLRQLCERGQGQEQQQFEFAKEHEIIRPLSDYGQFTAW
jgi:transposase